MYFQRMRIIIEELRVKKIDRKIQGEKERDKGKGKKCLISKTKLKERKK